MWKLKAGLLKKKDAIFEIWSQENWNSRYYVKEALKELYTVWYQLHDILEKAKLCRQ